MENAGRFNDAHSASDSEIYPDSRFPTSTLIIVEHLASEEFFSEIEASAAV